MPDIEEERANQVTEEIGAKRLFGTPFALIYMDDLEINLKVNLDYGNKYNLLEAAFAAPN